VIVAHGCAIEACIRLVPDDRREISYAARARNEPRKQQDAEQAEPSNTMLHEPRDAAMTGPTAASCLTRELLSASARLLKEVALGRSALGGDNICAWEAFSASDLHMDGGPT
jgi:hypothetical protein